MAEILTKTGGNMERDGTKCLTGQRTDKEEHRDADLNTDTKKEKMTNTWGKHH